MSELKERLERLADLGTPRGAETVWRCAQGEVVVRPIPARVRPGRQRRRWTVVALSLVVALVAAGLSYLVAGRDRRTVVSVAPNGSTDSLVLIARGGGCGAPGGQACDQYTIVDVATGASRLVTLPGKVGGDFNYDVIATGGYFVYQGARGVLAIPTALDRAPHLLGRPSVYLPSSRAGRVWLVNVPPGGVPVTGQEVSVDGRYHGPRYRLPLPQAPTVAVNGGLIFGAYVWHTATNTTRALPTTGSATPNAFDARGSLVAWGANCPPAPLSGCASLEVLNLDDGKLRIYPAPAGTTGWIPTGGEGSHDAFAPDGQHVALRAALTPAGLSSQLYVLNLASGILALVPHAQAFAYSPVAWSADGRSVLFESDTHTLGIYRLGDSTPRTLSQPCCGVNALITTPK